MSDSLAKADAIRQAQLVLVNLYSALDHAQRVLHALEAHAGPQGPTARRLECTGCGAVAFDGPITNHQQDCPNAGLGLAASKKLVLATTVNVPGPRIHCLKCGAWGYGSITHLHLCSNRPGDGCGAGATGTVTTRCVGCGATAHDGPITSHAPGCPSDIETQLESWISGSSLEQAQPGVEIENCPSPLDKHNREALEGLAAVRQAIEALSGTEVDKACDVLEDFQATPSLLGLARAIRNTWQRK